MRVEIKSRRTFAVIHAAYLDVPESTRDAWLLRLAALDAQEKGVDLADADLSGADLSGTNLGSA